MAPIDETNIGNKDPHPVKKRSLSSYLSNVGSRREERQRLEKENKEHEERKNREMLEKKRKEQEEVERINDKKEQEFEQLMRKKEEEQERINKQKSQELENLSQKDSIDELSKEKTQKEAEKLTMKDNEVYLNNDNNSIKLKQETDDTINNKNLVDQEVEKKAESKTNKENIDEQNENNSGLSSPLSETSYLENKNKSNTQQGILREDLKSMLTEPKFELGIFSSSSEEESNHEDDNEVLSDAPTEPASPPRPKLGRLVRGDQFVRSKMNPKNDEPFNNLSDSELSDLEDLYDPATNNKILQPESSPPKRKTSKITIPQDVSSLKDKTDNNTIQPESSPLRENKEKSVPNELSKTEALIPNNTRKRNTVSKTNDSQRKSNHITKSLNNNHKKSVYRDSSGRTKLQLACDKGKYDAAKKFLDDDYDVNAQDNAGNSALHEAALNGHLDIVKLLIEYGADVNIKSSESCSDTPLIDASANGHLNVVKYLLDHGADPLIANSKGITAYDSIEISSDLDEDEKQIVDDIKNTLRSAAKHWKNKHKTLVENNHGNKNDNIETYDEILDDDAFFWTDITSKEGKGKLLRASKNGRLPYVGAYLENGGKPDPKAFSEAVKFGHEDIVSLFLAFGMNVNTTNKDGETPLMLAVGRGNIGTVKLLIDAGADANMKDIFDRNALYYAKHNKTGYTDDEEIQLIKKVTNKADSVESSLEPESIKSETKSFGDDNLLHPEEHSPLLTKTDITSPVEPHDEETISKKNLSDQSENENNEVSVPVKSNNKRRSQENTSATNTTIDTEPSAKKRHIELSPKLPKKKEETPEEREERIKKEEEYVQKIQQIKKKKEQEFLHRIAINEQKRQEERERQKEEEANRLRELQEQQRRETEREKQAADLAKRKEIRNLYPIGLKFIDFSKESTNDFKCFLPLYYKKKNNVKYILDLQIMILLKDPSLLIKVESDEIKGTPLTEQEKLQQWNLLKFIFLYGGRLSGNTNKHRILFQDINFKARLDFERVEKGKFIQLPMHWISWNDVAIEDISTKASIESHMIEIADLDIVSEDRDSSPDRASYKHEFQTSDLPTRLQTRNDIKRVLDSVTCPLW